jgi:methylmalonyl-CoA mutase
MRKIMETNFDNFFGEFDEVKYEQWKSEAEAALKGAPFDKLMFTDTYEGIRLKPIYNKEDRASTSFMSNLPGFYPFSRGTNPSGYKKSSWEISQNIPYADCDEFNKALKNDLANGQNSIRLNFDKAIAMYEDFTEDDIWGYANMISDMGDMEKALNGIDLKLYPIHIDAGLASLPAFALLIAYMKSKSVDNNQAKASIVCDPLKELCLEGTLPVAFERLYDEMSIITKKAVAEFPQIKTISFASNHIHDEGGSATQELAYMASVLTEYTNQMLARDFDINSLADKFIIGLSVGTNYFMELAKFRAARIIASKIFNEFGATPENCKVTIHATTSERDIAALDPHINILRGTSQAFSAIMGLCDILTVTPFDNVYGAPTDFSRRIARNTQNVLLHESHLTDSIDPAAGSYYIDCLTEELAAKAWEEFQKIESTGGIVEYIKSNELIESVRKTFKSRYDNLAIRKDVIIGTNKYPILIQKEIDSVVCDQELIENYVNEYDKKLIGRNIEIIDQNLDEFENLLESNSTTSIDFAVKAFENGAVMAEVFNSLVHNIDFDFEVKHFELNRSSAPFEEIREKAILYKYENGTLPKLPLICIGKLKEFKPRADFSNDFFKVGGFDCDIYSGFEDVEKIDLNKIPQSKAYVFCSNDDLYAEFIPTFAKIIKEHNPDSFLILAGFPKDKIDEYKNAGIDDFIHIKSNILDSLNSLHSKFKKQDDKGAL